MPRTLFLRLDPSSLQGDDITAITTSPKVCPVDARENCFQYSFESIDLDHAMLGLGQNKARFGIDLWHYLHSAQGFFGRTDDGFIIMPASTPDFKRRYSEDLGVAVGSLLLAESLALKWETISQIPTNSKLDKHAKTPDFCGFCMDNRKVVYECKGTTAPDDVDKHRRKAKDQLSDHVELNVNKFALVTYVPTSARLIPPYVFVSDPPISAPLITEPLSVGLHYVLVLQFAGLEELVEPLRSALAMRYRIAEAESNGDEPSWHDRHESENLNGEFVAAVNIVLRQTEIVEYAGQQFVGTWRFAEDERRKIRVFLGVSTDQIVNVARALATPVDSQRPFVAPRFQLPSAIQNPKVTSLFSDGSLLLIEPPPAEEGKERGIR